METSDISVVYQDHHLLILNKPAGCVIHPTYKHADGTLWDALLVYLAQQGPDSWQPPNQPDEPEWVHAPVQVQAMLRQRRLDRFWKEEGLLPRPCLLHRLDKDTSGVVALARTERSRRHLACQFHSHTVNKHYLAVVQKGAPVWAQPRTTLTMRLCNPDGGETPFDPNHLFSVSPEETLLLVSPLWRDPDDRRRCIVIAGGQYAATRLNVLAVTNDMALLDVSPITGRTHQIRAHLAALGYAIVGDQVYAPLPIAGTPLAVLKRQFLHAYCLTLRRYPDNTVCTFTASLPEDLAAWLKIYCPLFSTRIDELLRATMLMPM